MNVHQPVQTHLRGRGAALSAGGWSPEGGRRCPAPLRTAWLSGRARLFRTSTPASASEWGKGVRTGWGRGDTPRHQRPQMQPRLLHRGTRLERAESPRLPAALELSSLHPHPAPPCPASSFPNALRPTIFFTSHPPYRLSYPSCPTPPRKLPPGSRPHALFSPSRPPLRRPPRPGPQSTPAPLLVVPILCSVPPHLPQVYRRQGRCRVVRPGGTRAGRWGDAPSSFPGFPRLPAPRLAGSQKSCK